MGALTVSIIGVLGAFLVIVSLLSFLAPTRVE